MNATHLAPLRLPRLLPTGAAGQLPHSVGVYRIDAATGTLSLRHEHAAGRNPSWVEAITPPRPSPLRRLR